VVAPEGDESTKNVIAFSRPRQVSRAYSVDPRCDLSLLCAPTRYERNMPDHTVCGRIACARTLRCAATSDGPARQQCLWGEGGVAVISLLPARARVRVTLTLRLTLTRTLAADDRRPRRVLPTANLVSACHLAIWVIQRL
jgi:hypothetical protein